MKTILLIAQLFACTFWNEIPEKATKIEIEKKVVAIDAYTVQSGNALAGSTWNIGIVPSATMNVQVKNGHHLIVNSVLTFKSIDFETGSFLDYLSGGKIIVTGP